jgi:hypothetical protein
MKRRAKTARKAVKAQRRRTSTHRNGRKAVRRRTSSAGQETEVARLTRERDEALEQQRATADVLKIISASPTELQPMLDAVVRSAARYCDADDVTIFERDGPDRCSRKMS